MTASKPDIVVSRCVGFACDEATNDWEQNIRCAHASVSSLMSWCMNYCCFVDRLESVDPVITDLMSHILTCTRHSAYRTVEVDRAWDPSECQYILAMCVVSIVSCVKQIKRSFSRQFLLKCFSQLGDFDRLTVWFCTNTVGILYQLSNWNSFTRFSRSNDPIW